jgi:hypothetical protein
MDREFVRRAVRSTLVALGVLTMLAATVAGASAALGALGGGALSLLSFIGLARGAAHASASFAGGRPRVLWTLGMAGRYLALFAGVAALLWAGVSPIGLGAGVTVLPAVVVTLGLRPPRPAA